MFRITEDPSSGRLVQCLAKNYKNDSFVFVDMTKVGVMAAYSDRVCSSLYMKALINRSLAFLSSSFFSLISATDQLNAQILVL